MKSIISQVIILGVLVGAHASFAQNFEEEQFQAGTLTAVFQTVRSDEFSAFCLMSHLSEHSNPVALAVALGGSVGKLTKRMSPHKGDFDYDLTLYVSVVDPLSYRVLVEEQVHCGSYRSYAHKH